MKYYLITFMLMTSFLCADIFSVIPKKDLYIYTKIIQQNEGEVVNVQIMDYDVEGFLLVTWK